MALWQLSGCQRRRHRRHRFDSWGGKIPWRRKWQSTPVFLPGKFPGQRSLVGYYSSRGHKELGMTEWLISHASKVMLKLLQARLQQYVNHELPDVQLVLEKAEEPEIKLTTSAGSSKKQKSSRETSSSALLTMPKPSTVWITINCRNFWKRWAYQTTWPASWETYMQVRNQ